MSNHVLTSQELQAILNAANPVYVLMNWDVTLNDISTLKPYALDPVYPHKRIPRYVSLATDTLHTLPSSQAAVIKANSLETLQKLRVMYSMGLTSAAKLLPHSDGEIR